MTNNYNTLNGAITTERGRINSLNSTVTNLNTALTTNYKRIVYGSYTGNNKHPRTINLGVTPNCILIQQNNYDINAIGSPSGSEIVDSYPVLLYPNMKFYVMAGSSAGPQVLSLTGASLVFSSTKDSIFNVWNKSNIIYYYIIFVS